MIAYRKLIIKECVRVENVISDDYCVRKGRCPEKRIKSRRERRERFAKEAE